MKTLWKMCKTRDFIKGLAMLKGKITPIFKKLCRQERAVLVKNHPIFAITESNTKMESKKQNPVTKRIFMRVTGFNYCMQ